MLHFALAFGAASPIVLHHRLVLAVRAALTAVFRLGFSLALGIATYTAALFALVTVVPAHGPGAQFADGIGIALATLAAVLAASRTAPQLLARVTVFATGALTALLPVGLYLYNGAAGDWRGVYLWYLAASLAGSLAAMHRTVAAPAGGQRSAA